MDACILYGSPERLGDDQTAIEVKGGGVFYVRAERVTADSLIDALFMCEPREGESLLNTQPLAA